MRASALFLALFLLMISQGHGQSNTVVNVAASDWVNVERYKANSQSAYDYRELNHGSEDRAYCGRNDYVAGYTNTFRLVYKFDLSQIPSAANIQQVKLMTNVSMG